MEPPPWEQKVSFKHALAVAAVLKRQHDRQQSELDEKCSTLQRQVEDLQIKHASLQSDTSAGRLKAFLHRMGSDHAIPGEHQFTAQLISLELWNRAIKCLPQHAPFLCHLHEYGVLQGLSTALFFSGLEPVPGVVAAALQITPAHALVSVLKDMIQQSVEYDAMRRVNECLRDFCAISQDVMTPEDVDTLQDFIMQLLMAGSGLQGLMCLAVENLVDAGSAEAKEQHVKGSNKAIDTSLASTELLTILQRQPSTGILVMASAAYCLQSILKSLAGEITGDIKEDGVDTPPQGGGSTTNPQGLPNESNMLVASHWIASLLHRCLRDLPEWISTSEMTIDDEFFSGIASVVWSTAELGTIVSPVHPEVARESQRCAALLISALQRISAPRPGFNA